MSRTRTANRPDERTEQRLNEMEDLLRNLMETRSDAPDRHEPESAGAHCALPEVPPRPRVGDISDFRESLIAKSEKKWANGTQLRYYFFDRSPLKGTASNEKMVREAFSIWKDLGIGLEFTETALISEAELRISFQRGIGSWSYVGTDCLNIPHQHEPTMNFGWDLRHDPRGIDTPLHEIGHALGFPHEHQNPNAGITWDEDEVIRQFSGPPNNWSLAKIKHNILNKHALHDVEGTDWDPDSVMHYGFEAGLIQHPAKYRTGLEPAPGLSDLDKSEVIRFYPPLGPSDYQTLAPFHSEVLNLEPAEQRNFILRPEETRTHFVRCIGSADMSLVLFRKDDSRFTYVMGYNDAGTDENAQMEVRLERGVEYVLRARMISNCDRQFAAVVYW